MCFLNLRPLGQVASVRILVNLSVLVQNNRPTTVKVIRSETQTIRESRRTGRSARFSFGLWAGSKNKFGRDSAVVPARLTPSFLFLRERNSSVHKPVRMVSVRQPNEEAATSSWRRESPSARSAGLDRPETRLAEVAPEAPPTYRRVLNPRPVSAASLHKGRDVGADRLDRFGVIQRVLTIARRESSTPIRKSGLGKSARGPTGADDTTIVPASGRTLAAARTSSRHPTGPTGVVAIDGGWGRHPVEIIPRRGVRSSESGNQANLGTIQDPPPLVVRSASAKPSNVRDGDPVHDESLLRKQITETVERTVHEVVERRLESDPRLGSRLTGQIRSELFQDLVFERERLGVD